MQTTFKNLSNHLSEFEKNGWAKHDQFALFFEVIEDFLPYYSMYIAIRSSNWELRICFEDDGTTIHEIWSGYL